MKEYTDDHEFPIGYKVKHNGETYEVVDWGISNNRGIVYDLSNGEEEITIDEDKLIEWNLNIENHKAVEIHKIFILTAFGPMIDTICEVFKTKNEAKEWLENKWMEIENKTKTPLLKEIVCTDCWKTDDPNNQNIEWQIHEREF